ncbi:MAG: DUF554 domain-containing protein [Peptococcaceae bacterium]|nr:DUF554 domain-containing protein [Peptococcaceae bacterium]
MIGVTVNTLAIIVGTIIGLLFRRGISEKVKVTVIQGIGLAVLLIGAKMATGSANSLVLILSLVAGGLIGEIVDIEKRLINFGTALETKLQRNGKQGDFTNAFVTTSLIYCVGAMAIMGALQSGLQGNNQILFAKSMLDGISAIVFASSMGIGVAASAIPVFVYEGILAVSATYLQGILSQSVIAEMSATGGLLIVGIALSVLQIKQIKVGNLLPSILCAVGFTILFQHFGIY